MDWWYLLFAGLMEIVWAVGLKYTENFSKLYPSLITLAAMFFSFHFLSLALQTIPMGTAYAVWTGIGVIGVALIGIVYCDESVGLLRLFCLGMILTGILGLKLLHV